MMIESAHRLRRTERTRDRTSGFTTMELLLAIAVMAIVTSLAVPAFTQFIQNNRLSAQANEMVAALQFARSEALKRGAEVRICSSGDGASCGGSWNQGWIAVVDPTDTAEVIRVWQTPGTDFQFSPSSGTVGFNAQGFSAGNAAQQFDLQLSGCTSDSARRVLVERTGRVASQRINCTSS